MGSGESAFRVGLDDSQTLGTPDVNGVKRLIAHACARFLSEYGSGESAFRNWLDDSLTRAPWR